MLLLLLLLLQAPALSKASCIWVVLVSQCGQRRQEGLGKLLGSSRGQAHRHCFSRWLEAKRPLLATSHLSPSIFQHEICRSSPRFRLRAVAVATVVMWCLRQGLTTLYYGSLRSTTPHLQAQCFPLYLPLRGPEACKQRSGVWQRKDWRNSSATWCSVAAQLRLQLSLLSSFSRRPNVQALPHSDAI